MKVNIESLRKWMNKGAFNTSAANDAVDQLEQIMDGEGQLFEHVWKDVEEKPVLRIKVELVFLIDAFGRHAQQSHGQGHGQSERSV